MTVACTVDTSVSCDGIVCGFIVNVIIIEKYKYKMSCDVIMCDATATNGEKMCYIFSHAWQEETWGQVEI